MTSYPQLFYLCLKDFAPFPLKILKGNIELVNPCNILIHLIYLQKSQECSPLQKMTTRVQKLLEGYILEVGAETKYLNQSIAVLLDQ